MHVYVESEGVLMCVWICDSLDDKTVEELCDNGNTTEGVLLWVYIM